MVLVGEINIIKYLLVGTKNFQKANYNNIVLLKDEY